MDQVLIIISIIGAIVTVITFSEKITKIKSFLVNSFSKKKNIEIKIVNKMIEYYNFFTENMDKENCELKYSKMEDEIDFILKNIKYKMVLKFDNKFIDKYMKYIGYKKEFRTTENFYKYSHLYFKNTDLILELSKSTYKIKIDRLNFPLKDIWGQFRANRFIFCSQYKKRWEGVPEIDKIFLQDIEMPIKLLKIYYNIII